MTLPTSRTEWRKSSHSGNGGANCVEVAFVGSAMALRDSKNPVPSFEVGLEAAALFVAAAKSGLVGA